MAAQLPGVVVRFLGLMVAPIQRSAIIDTHPWLFKLALYVLHPLRVALLVAIAGISSYVVRALENQ